MVHMVQNKTNTELEIVLVLIRNKSHLREIARTLKIPHSTVLRRINELVKRGVLDYTAEGKNKVFFIKNTLNAKNHVYSAEIYKLSKVIEKNPGLGIILEEIKNKVPKGMIILFGSYAKGIEKKESDIDIYVETQDRKIKQEIQMINSRLSIKTGGFDMDSLLVKEIIKNHVIVRGLEEFYGKSKFFEKA